MGTNLSLNLGTNTGIHEIWGQICPRIWGQIWGIPKFGDKFVPKSVLKKLGNIYDVSPMYEDDFGVFWQFRMSYIYGGDTSISDVFFFMMMVTIMFIVHLDEVLGADEAVPLFVKHSESFSDVALDVRVLELPLMEER